MNKTSGKGGSLSHRLEAFANVVIVIAGVMLIALIAQRFLLGSAETKKQIGPMRPTIGNKVEVPGIEFAGDRKTIFLALQITCRYCTESMQFYRRMIDASDSSALRFIAVLPTRPEDGVRYLTDHGITGVDVIQAPLSSLQAGATPTILLTDETGSITKSWIGKLPPETEAEVIDSLQAR